MGDMGLAINAVCVEMGGYQEFEIESDADHWPWEPVVAFNRFLLIYKNVPLTSDPPEVARAKC